MTEIDQQLKELAERIAGGIVKEYKGRGYPLPSWFDTTPSSRGVSSEPVTLGHPPEQELYQTAYAAVLEKWREKPGQKKSYYFRCAWRGVINLIRENTEYDSRNDKYPTRISLEQDYTITKEIQKGLTGKRKAPPPKLDEQEKSAGEGGAEKELKPYTLKDDDKKPFRCSPNCDGTCNFLIDPESFPQYLLRLTTKYNLSLPQKTCKGGIAHFSKECKPLLEQRLRMFNNIVGAKDINVKHEPTMKKLLKNYYHIPGPTSKFKHWPLITYVDTQYDDDDLKDLIRDAIESNGLGLGGEILRKEIYEHTPKNLIAQELGKDPKTIRNYKKEAIDKLRNFFESCENIPGLCYNCFKLSWCIETIGKSVVDRGIKFPKCPPRVKPKYISNIT